MLSYPGISKGILPPNNAVGVEMDFLNQETDPSPRPHCIPGWKPFGSK